LIIVIFVLIICGAFLYPSFEWYFLVPESKKELAAGSREQIRAYSRRKAAEDIAQLKKIASQDAGTDEVAPLPADLSFLTGLAKENYKLDEKKLPTEWTVAAVLASFSSETEAFEALESYYREELLDLKDRSGKILQLGLDLSGGMSILLQADIESLEERLGHSPTQDDANQAIDRAMEILTNRIDRFGVFEPSIRRAGTDQISIEIPGAADPERVNAFLMGKGSLNFHKEDMEATGRLQDYLASNPGELYDDNGRLAQPDWLEAGRVARGFYQKDEYGIDQLIRPLIIYEEVALDGTHIREATVGTHPITGKPVINFTLDREGGEIFFQFTSANVDNNLAIVLDDKVKAGARISGPIRERVQMTGFDRLEATNLALVLRTAAMPVDLKVANQQAVGASLGEDSIQEGLRAISLGGLLVIAFMLAYYKGAGIAADVALMLNLVLIVAILSAFNLTLTLTSIAGLILTVGMAVDANVIIFERIKEEYRLGKSPDASVKAGFRKAFWTVMDANITTFIAALVLSQVGSGPIQGFANTLAVGIVSSMFTALFVSRLMFDFGIETLRMKKLSIGWRI